MDDKGLIFIPDISGFTRFMHEVEIEHSQVIIQELLETIINANQIGLEISEIEGDAILFYKFGAPPDMASLYKQVEKMFHDFHRYLMAYDQRRICQCEACKSASSLTLKVITHYGEFKGFNMKGFTKNSLNLHGKDIIIAHQLMKNDIDLHEYWLVTDELFPQSAPAQLPEWVNWNSSTKETDTGQIPFKYAQLTPLKDMMPQEEQPDFDIKNKRKALTVSGEINADMDTTFAAALNFDSRNLWSVGIKGAEDISTAIPQVGTHHRCVVEKGKNMEVFSSGFSYQPEKIVYSETDEKKMWSSTYIFEKISENKTRLTIDMYVKNNIMIAAMFRLTMKKKLTEGYKKSLVNLEQFIIKNQATAANPLV